MTHLRYLITGFYFHYLYYIRVLIDDFMKNLSLGLNLVLTVAVIVLYILHFQGKDTEVASSPATETVTTTDSSASTTSEAVDSSDYAPDFSVALNPASNLPIAYVNLEELDSRYKFITDLRSQMEGDEKRISARLNKEYEEIMLDYQEFAKNVQSGAYSSQQEVAQREQTYQLKLQKLEEKRRAEEKKFYDKQNALQSKINKNVSDYLKKYSQKFEYSYILATGALSSVLYASDSLDITEEVIKGLNAEYKK